MNESRERNLARLREEAYVIEPGQKFVVDYFKPEDAVGVARLYYAVYGEMFPVDYVYDPDELVRVNAGDDLFQAVGRTEKGDVVGLYAMFRSAPGRRIMEAGSWMVHPEYRGTSVGLRVARKIHSHPPEHLGLAHLHGQCVCDHPTSQKLGELFKAHFSALEIEPMPPRPGEAGEYGRISLLDGIFLLRNTPDEIYLPERYAAQLQEIYEWMGLDRTFLTDSNSREAFEALAGTELSAAPIGESGTVRMDVESFGPGLADRLADAEREYPGMHVYQVLLPLWLPGISVAVEIAHEAGYFFGGTMPLWFDHDALLLQKVAGSPDFTKPLLHTEEGRALVAMIEADWKTLWDGQCSS